MTKAVLWLAIVLTPAVAAANTCNYQTECFDVKTKEEITHTETFTESGVGKTYGWVERVKDFDLDWTHVGKAQSSNCMNYKEWDSYYDDNRDGFTSIGGGLFDSAGVRWDRCGDPDKESNKENVVKGFDYKKWELLSETHWVREITKTWTEIIETTKRICKHTIGGVTPVPEPGTLLLFGVGLGCVALYLRGRRK